MNLHSTFTIVSRICLLAVGGFILLACGPKANPTASNPGAAAPSVSSDTISPPDLSKLTKLEVTNFPSEFSGPPGVIVYVPSGCSAKPMAMYKGQTTKRKDRKIPEMIETKSGAQAVIRLGQFSPEQMPKEIEGLQSGQNVPPLGVKVVSGSWQGYYLDQRLDPVFAEIYELKGDWERRIYMLIREKKYILALDLLWPARAPLAKTEAIGLAEAIIGTIEPDLNAKELDFFPGAGNETNRPVPGGIEVAMADGMVIEATTKVGKIRIEAGPQSKRSYTWEGATRSVIMEPRQGERWNGSMGLNYPGPGNHWEDHKGIARGVLEEGQQHFKSQDEAMEWLKTRNYFPFVHTSSGLVVGWGKYLSRKQLNVEVWQIMINGKKPTSLPGSSDDKIKVLKTGRK